MKPGNFLLIFTIAAALAGYSALALSEKRSATAAREQAAAIVVYCQSSDCGKSLWTAIRLRNEGLTQTRIYPEGWNEWSANGLPAARSDR